MAFLNQLSEKLEAQQIYDGMVGKYETRFKVEGFEYAFLATSVGGDYDDNSQWMLEFENIKSHRIGMGDSDPKVAKAFGEAVDQWVKERNPHCFYTYGSHIEALTNIIESVKKKVKKYNIIDDTAERKDESTGEVIEGNPVGIIKWTQMVEDETIPSEEKSNTKQDEFEKTYEEPKDSKVDKAFTTFKKDEKLSKNDGSYDMKTESFSEFKERKLDESMDLEFFNTNKDEIEKLLFNANVEAFDQIFGGEGIGKHLYNKYVNLKDAQKFFAALDPKNQQKIRDAIGA